MQNPVSHIDLALILVSSLTHVTNILHVEHSFLDSIFTHINLTVILTRDANKFYTHCRLQSDTNGSHARFWN